jgi:hypothetical protein
VEPNSDARPSNEAVRDVDDSADGRADWNADWSWPPYAPVPAVDESRFPLEEWAPASTVRHPWVRLGRWTLLYRRAA